LEIWKTEIYESKLLANEGAWGREGRA